MKKILTYSFACLSLLLWGSCSDKEAAPDVRGGDPIALSAAGTPVSAGTRAVSDFPNGGSIGVLASTYDETNTDEDGNIIINWQSYADIVNAPAKATGFNESDQSYSFGWGLNGNQPKYWPFDGSKLVFMAYGPHTDAYPWNLLLDMDSLKNLFVTLHENNYNTPDVMVATNNGNRTPYNKDEITSTPTSYTSPPVDLGDFKHMMSQLTVEVRADGGMQGNIVITDLHVRTPRRSGSLSLVDSEWINQTDGSPFTYRLFPETGTTETAFQSAPVSKTVLLFPGSEDVTTISITLLDKGASTPTPYMREFMMPFFPNIDPASTETMKLEQGMNTTLRLTVKNIGIPTPTTDINLEGVLSDWNERGKFGVTIN